jgi:transketolase
MKTNDIKELKKIAVNCRKNVLRMIKSYGSGHLGPAYSCIDIVTALYFHGMRVDPQNPGMADRDIFLLSAGHKSMAQYAVLAEAGFFEEDVLDTFCRFESRVPGHPDMSKLPGVEANTGSLGHGLSLACGIAMGKKQDGQDAKVFVLLGDGELAEGSNWEAAAVAAHYKLDNLTVFVDHNGLQISGSTEEVMSFEPVAEHFAGFGWKEMQIAGNDMAEIVGVVDALPFERGKPNLIVANTVKGKGFFKVENQVDCHYWNPSAEDMALAEKELEDSLARLENETRNV